MKTSDRGIEFIASWEGFFSMPYNCPANHCTVGFGHLIHYGPCDGRESEKQFENGLIKEQALELLRKDLEGYEADVERIFGEQMEENKNDALVSLTYNVGAKNLMTFGPNGGPASVVLKIKAGKTPEEFKPNWLAWCHGGGKTLPGLVRRRDAEWLMYANGEYRNNC